LGATTIGARPEARRSRARKAGLARRTGRHTLYDVLQVGAQADEAIILAAFRVLARTYHPDLNSDPGAPERMRELNAAYRVLSDPRRRAIYDLELNQRRCTHHEADEPSLSVQRPTACWRCADPIAGALPRYCGDCRWIICDACRGCGCEHPGRPLLPLVRRAQTAAGWFTAGLVLVAWFASRMLGVGS
jgi:DnaJ-domain-containing protein 1